MELLLIILVLILGYSILEYNVIMSLKNKVKQSKSSIDIYLNQRFDLIPNLVETVKAHANYEKEIINNIVRLRASYMRDKNLNDANLLNSQLTNLMGVAEEYPELKASESFLNLQRTLIKQESQIQAARRIYNGDVTLYNTKIKTFPGNIVANMLALEESELFEIEEYKKENITKFM